MLLLTVRDTIKGTFCSCARDFQNPWKRTAQSNRTHRPASGEPFDVYNTWRSTATTTNEAPV